jgi:hypothetical protein
MRPQTKENSMLKKALAYVGNGILWIITGIIIAVVAPVAFGYGFMQELRKPGTYTA